jgi:ATP-dependent Lon protease
MSKIVTLPVLPLDDGVVLPGMVVPLDLSESDVRAAIDAARANAGARGPGIRSEAKPQVLLVPRLNGKYAAVGALGVVEQTGRLPGGGPGAVVRGVRRVRIGAGTTGPGAALWVEGTEVEETGLGARAEELAKEYKALVVGVLEKRGAWQVVDVVQQIDDPSLMADRSGYASYLTVEQKVRILETADVAERLELAIGWTREHLAELDVAETIRKDVEEGVEKQQKEFLLRRQLAAIRKELNELNGDPSSEEEDYRVRVEEADLPEKVREAALKEVAKLERAAEQGPEGGWIRTWLDTVLDVPWNERTDDAYDISEARRVLDADHTGLDDVKERIVEYLAVRKRRQDRGLG